MKFTCSVEIDLPRDRVVALWSDPDNLKHWQDGLQSMDMLSDKAGQPGSKTRFVYLSGKHRIELMETIQVNNLPEEFSGLYEAREMTNLMTNRFHVIDDRRTRWDAEIHYQQFNGLLIKLFAKLMPGKFRNQTQKWLDQFKAFAEAQG